MAHDAVYIPPYKDVPVKDLRERDGREWVVFESLVAVLALLLIISGFALYVGRTFDTPARLPGGAIEISTQNATEPPLSLVEA